MAIRNQQSGYQGFVLWGMGGNPIDRHGDVTRVIFGITYPPQVEDVEFTISNGADDWGAKMGDGSIIPLSNPVVLYQNRDNSIVQFDMSTKYPSNSPCTLVYRSDTAVMNIKRASSPRPFAPNTISGHFAFTVEGYGGGSYEHGDVDRLIVEIPFPQQIIDVDFSMSTGEDDWAARMGDGMIIDLYDPEILSVNRNNAVVKFSMKQAYPSNSPCVILYKNENASFTITPRPGDQRFVPVTEITDVPTVVAAGIAVDLSVAGVVPFDASVQGITWSIESGPATVEQDSFLATGMGQIVLRGTIDGGLGTGNPPYTQTFNIQATENSLSITGQPPADIAVDGGNIDIVINVFAKATTNEIHYKWFHNRNNSYQGASVVSGAINPAYKLPMALEAGDHYYFVEVSSPGAPTIRSQICHVFVRVAMEQIQITPRVTQIDITKEAKLGYTVIPNGAYVPHLIWSSSDDNIVQVIQDDAPTAEAASDMERGVNRGGCTIKAINSGEAIITLSNVDGSVTDRLFITVNEFTSVTDITGIPAIINTGERITLNATITPTDASNKDIVWEISSPGTVGASINGNTIIANTPGVFSIRGTIVNGSTPSQNYSKEFSITVLQSFIAVTDVNLTGLPSEIRANDSIELVGHVLPENATHKTVTFEVSDPGTTGCRIGANRAQFTGPGTATIRAVIDSGRSPTEKYQRDFQITVLPAWVSVTQITTGFDEWDPNPTNGEPIEITAEVIPANATKKTVTIKLIDPGDAQISFNPIGNTMSCDPSKMDHTMEPTATFEFRVKDGVSPGTDFVANLVIKIIPPLESDFIVSITDIELKLPEPMRAFYPVLLSESVVYPWNATNKNIAYRPERISEEDCCNIQLLCPDTDDMDFSMLSPHLGFFEWERPGKQYLFPWNSGRTRLEIKGINGKTVDPDDKYCAETENYYQYEELQFDDPFISVADIGNIPLQIPCQQEIVLSGELLTNGGLNFYNPMWDEEVPSYRDLQWRMGSQYFNTTMYPNTAGAVLRDNNIVYADHPGRFTIQAYVPNGLAEPIKWYDLEQTGRAFTKLITIEVVEAEKSYSKPIVTLTLDSGREVKIYKEGDLSKISNDLPDTTSITIGYTSFRKNQVTKIEFWEEKKNWWSWMGDSDSPKITSLRNFARNFTSLREIDRIPNTVSGPDCLRDFLNGCTRFNQPLTIPSSAVGPRSLMYFLRGCTSFNSKISIPYGITGEDCMHGFLYGCISFNTRISIPASVTGRGCLERFMYGCTEFNQDISVPSGLSGPRCMFNFMAYCKSFNKPFRLPDDVGSEEHELNLMFKECANMASSVYVPELTGQHAGVSDQTFSCVFQASSIIQLGLPIIGPGATALKERCLDNDYPPRRHVYVGDISERPPEEHAHEWGEWETVSEPTYTEPGEAIRYCICGETETKEIPVLEAPTVTVKFAVVNGTISATEATITVMNDDGEIDPNGTARLTTDDIPTVTPDEGYENGSWDEEPYEGRIVEDEQIFTYTFDPIPEEPGT